MDNKPRKIIYYLIAIFILIFFYFASPMDLTRAIFPILVFFGLAFLTLGIVLIVLSRKEKGKLKFFLMLTGVSTTMPLVFSVLHNGFYALGIAFVNFTYLFEILHVACFLIALLVAPILFIIGVVASLVLLHRR